MKKIQLLTLALLFIFFGCKEQEGLEPIVVDDSIVEIQDERGARAIPNGDPNLDPNFNWETANWTVRYFASGSVSAPLSLINPFHNDPIYGNAVPGDRDYTSADGWMLVARDFGTASSAPVIPWILLYNKYRGLLRLCALRTSSLGTSYQSAEVLLDTSTPVPDLFEFAGSTTQIATTESGSLEWMVSEYNFQGYDASIAQQARLRINFREVTNFDLELNGGLSLTGVAQPKPKLVNGIYDVATHSSKIWDKIGDLGKTTFKNVVKNVAKNPFSITSAAAGIIKGLTGAGGAPTYSIQLEGSVSLDGTMTQSTPIGSVNVYLRDDAVRGQQPIALQDIPWGVMNYNSPVELDREIYISGGFRITDLREKINTNPGFMNNILVTNPDITADIDTIELGWVIQGENNVLFRSESSFAAVGFLSDETIDSDLLRIPEAVAVRITFDNDDVVYNRIPVQFNFL